MDPFSIAALGLGVYSAVTSGNAAQKTAAAAAADAERIRQEGRRRAADTRAALGSEIKAMRTLRSAGMPAHQQAAQIAFLQAKKGSERIARNRSMGRLAPEVRDAVFGGQFEQYVGREAQKSARYAQMTQAIFGMAKEQQSQVNQILGQADAGYAQGMQFSRQMEFEAGDPMAKAAGALAQGAALQAKSNQAEAALKQQQEASFKQSMVSGMMFGDLTPAQLQERMQSTQTFMGEGGGYDQFSKFMFGGN